MAKPNTASTVLIGWATFYGAPVMLILARGVPLRRAMKIAGKIFVCGLPVAGAYGLLSLLMSGLLGLAGGFTLAALLIGWIALLGVALFYGQLGIVVDKMKAPAPIQVGEPELPALGRADFLRSRSS
jgi:hypothetical protein